MADHCLLLNFMIRKDAKDPDGGTNVDDNLSRCFNHFVKFVLGIIISASELGGQDLDTYFELF